MLRHIRQLGLGLLLLLGACASAKSATGTAAAHGQVGTTSASKLLVNRDHRGIAIAGYDPVAYFTDGKPVVGDPQIWALHRGATYLFASEDHRWQFLREPEHYAPAFGGYCGFAASIARLSPTSPEYWQIIDNRLVLQHNQHAFELFNKDAVGNLAQADANWPKLRDQNALPDRNVVNADRAGLALAGYDPISYFEGAPVAGSPDHYARYGGATYLFTSEAHRARFEGSPAHYAPAFGGFCGYAASIGVFAPVDPHLYLVIHDRLVLQHTAQALQLFNRDPEASLRQADANWPALSARAGS